MKSMKEILAEFREYSQKVSSLEKLIESRKAKARRLEEDREVFNEISRDSADKIYDWMRDTEGMPYDFEKLFDGAMRVYFPLASEEGMRLSKIVKALKDAGWEVPEIDIGYGPYKAFETKKVKQKLQRLAADGGGEYEVEVDVADLRLVRKTLKTIPAGPRKGETVERKEETTMAKAIARMVKSGKLDTGILEWWQNKQVLYTRDGQHRQIEKAFEGEDGSEYSVVVSRHPIDVLRMSDISNIRSCHSEGSEYFHCAIAEAKGHGPIAYLVKTEDLEDHLMDKPDDLTPTQQLGRAMNSLDRDAYREKMAKDFDLGSPAGRWVYLETWAATVDGGKWLKELEQRIEMASVPEKFRVSFMKAKAGQLGVPVESLTEYYKVWQEGGNALFNYPQDKLEGYEKARKAVYEKEPAPNDLKPISDFDNQELFRDRDRNIQGIGASARLRLRKFEEPMRFGTFAVPEIRTYGANVPGFVSSVKKWATDGQREQFVDDDGEVAFPRMQDLTRRGGTYGDNNDGDILNKFFRTMADKDGDSGLGWTAPYYANAEADRAEEDEEDEVARLYEEYEERVGELNDHASTTLQYVGCHASVEDTGEEPYVYADMSISYDIDLPWEDFEESGDYIVPGSEAALEEIEQFIPKPWGGNWADRNNFASATENGVDYYPEETDWNVQKGNDGKVYVSITHRINMEDGNTPDDYENFVDYAETIDKKYRENKEGIRRRLVEDEFIGPNDWDNLADDFSEMEETLKNWSILGVGDDDGEVIFSLRPSFGTKAGTRALRTGIQWPYGAGSEYSTTSTLAGIFGGAPATFGLERYLSLTSGSPGTVMAKGGILFKRAFRALQDAANEYARRQMTLDFGPEYEETFEPMELAKNMEIGLNLIESSKDPERLELAFHIRLRVFSEDNTEDIEQTFNFVKYIDANMDQLKAAAADAYQDEVTSWHQQKLSDERKMTDGTTVQRNIKQARAFLPDVGDPRRGYLEVHTLLNWVEMQFDKMKSAAEKLVATRITTQIANRAIGSYQWNTPQKLPSGWDADVKQQMVRMGATFSQKEAYDGRYLATDAAVPEIKEPEAEETPALRGTLGEPRPAFEAQLREEVYKRLQKKILKKKVKSHLTEKIAERKRLQKQQVRELVKSKLIAQGLTEVDLGYTQRTYKINFRIAMSKEHGGKREETENEMRAVPGVGTVKILAGTTRQDGSNYYADAMIKFHLLGKRSVVQYIRLELLPALRAIEGLSVLRMDRYEEITAMREWADAYANAGASPQQGAGTARRATPTPTIDAIAQDWMNVGTRGTANIHASSLAHSVADVTMIPVIELMRYLGTNYFSATTKEFEELKQQIINAGVPSGSIQVVIGKNGRIKLSAGDDIVLAAKDIGLKELPVTFSLVLQV